MPNPIHSLSYRIFRQMLAESRVSKGMLQQEVAEKLGKHQSYVSKYERGERRLDFTEFVTLADVLAIDVAEFIELYRRNLLSAASGEGMLE